MAARQVPEPSRMIEQISLPMSPWNRNALLSLRGVLKISVIMHPVLSMMLEIEEGGFMNRHEAQLVRELQGSSEQMSRLIDILCDKDDMDFNTFLQMLRRANYEVWAIELKRKAEELKREEAHPMSPWNRDALVSLREKLQLRVLMETGLCDLLEKAAGGFMSRVEAMVVREQPGNVQQMGKLIDILCGKDDNDFSTFLQMLRRANYEVWAMVLKMKAEGLKREAHPMSPWNRDALVSLREKLQLSVLMETGLGDRLEEAAGGFMSRVEAMVVREQQDNSKQMGKLIDILCRKGDDDFSTFLQLLHKTHNRVWAKELERKAEQLKRAEEFQLESRPADPDGKAEAEAIEPAAERRAYPEEQTRLWKFIDGVFSQLRHDCPIFGILVIGETGTGKSTLINNLLGREVAVIGHTMESETQLVTPHELTVEGVPVVVYDTPGLDDTEGDDDKKHLEIMKSLLARKKIHLVIYCMKLTETRMRRGLIRTFKEYHKIGVPWEQTVFTITFADVIVDTTDTTARFTQMQQHLKKILVEKVGVTSSVVDVLKICPTAKDPTEALPSGKQWYVPFWLDVVQVLVPAALVQFLHIHKDNIQIEEGTPVSRHPNPVNITLFGEDQKRFQREVDRLPELRATSATAHPDAVTDGATTPPTETAAEVLDHFRDRFIKDAASSTIMYELKHRDVIASGDVAMIERKADVTQQNQYLHECLMRKCTKEALMEVCNVMSAVRGNPIMNALGKDMRRRLKAPPSLVHMVLEKYEEDFFKCVNAKLRLRRLIRRGVIADTIKGDIESANDDEAREILFDHLKQNANVDTLKEYLKVAIAADGYPNMQSLGRKMMEELQQGGEQTH